MLSPLHVEHLQHTVTFYQSQPWRAAVCKFGGFNSGRRKDQCGGSFAAQPETTSAVSGWLLTAKRLEKHHLQMQLGAGGLERGGRHGLKPMLRTPRSSMGMMPRLTRASWLSAHGRAERRANSAMRGGFVWAQGGRAGMPGLHFG